MKLNKEEIKHVEEFKKSWEGSPYPPIFVTADTLVTCGGNILVIRRGGILGKGLLALPGGFIEQGESILDGAIRELREETQFIIEQAHLVRAFDKTAVFDEPCRDPRGRCITHVCHFVFSDLYFPMIETVVGSDDASEALWITRDRFYNTFSENDFFLDHYRIIRHFLEK